MIWGQEFLRLEKFCFHGADWWGGYSFLGNWLSVRPFLSLWPSHLPSFLMIFLFVLEELLQFTSYHINSLHGGVWSCHLVRKFLILVLHLLPLKLFLTSWSSLFIRLRSISLFISMWSPYHPPFTLSFPMMKAILKFYRQEKKKNLVFFWFSKENVNSSYNAILSFFALSIDSMPF